MPDSAEPQVHLDWRRLKLSWTVAASDIVDPRRALHEAAAWLRSERADVNMLPEGRGLKFRPPTWAGRSWLATLSAGRVDVAVLRGTRWVSASGRLYPLLGWPLMIFLIGGLAHLSVWAEVGIYLFLVMANGLFPWFKLERLARIAAGRTV